MILGATRLLNRVEVRGGAGSGKTWLARRAGAAADARGQRVALLCYSRGLAAYLRRDIQRLPRRQRPAYVGRVPQPRPRVGRRSRHATTTATTGSTGCRPQMVELAPRCRSAQRFDAVVIDEAQDFADDWWPAVLAALQGRGGGRALRLQRRRPARVRPLRPAAGAARAADARPEPAQHPADRGHVQLARADADAAVRWRRAGGALRRVRRRRRDGRRRRRGRRAARRGLASGGHRAAHHRQPAPRAGQSAGRRGRTEYWESFWDPEQVFYGHVLGFKGLERRAVVLVLNERKISDRSRERLYVGLSRARDQLVVCGDPETIRQVGGQPVLDALLVAAGDGLRKG